MHVPWRNKILFELENSECDVIAAYGECYGIECGFSRDMIINLVKEFPSEDVAKIIRANLKDGK